MPRLVTKFKYLKPGVGGKSVGGYARYIATREGAEKLDDSHRHAPATQRQQVLIEKILRDFPDTKGSHEYEDFHREQTVGNASEFISMAIEENLDAVANIDQNYTERISPESLSERFLLSKEHICSLFRRELGMTASEYVNMVKLNHAVELLSNSSMNVSQISEYLGYSSVYYFSRLFKRRYGVSPSMYIGT